jgi:hypothetical protein
MVGMAGLNTGRAGANYCEVVAEEKPAMGSGWSPQVILHVVDTARYVWVSNSQLTNVELGRWVASSLRTDLGFLVGRAMRR